MIFYRLLRRSNVNWPNFQNIKELSTPATKWKLYEIEVTPDIEPEGTVVVAGGFLTYNNKDYELFEIVGFSPDVTIYTDVKPRC